MAADSFLYNSDDDFGLPQGMGVTGSGGLLGGGLGGGGLSGLLGNLGGGLRDNSNFFAMLGAGLMGAPRQNPFQNAMQATATGSQLDLRQQAELLKRKQDADRRAAYAAYAAKNPDAMDAEIARNDPDAAAAIYKSNQTKDKDRWLVVDGRIVRANDDGTAKEVMNVPPRPNNQIVPTGPTSARIIDMNNPAASLGGAAAPAAPQQPPSQLDRLQQSVMSGAAPQTPQAPAVPSAAQATTGQGGLTIPMQPDPSKSPQYKALGDQVQEGFGKANAAIDNIRATNSARSLIDQGIFSGKLGDPKLAIAKVGSALGYNDPRIANTEALGPVLAQKVLSTVKTLGTNPSNSDRIFAEKMAGGQIGLDEASMRRILDIDEKLNRQFIEMHNGRASQFSKLDPYSTPEMAGQMQVKQPDPYAPPKPNGGFSREDLEAEARRRGLLR